MIRSVLKTRTNFRAFSQTLICRNHPKNDQPESHPHHESSNQSPDVECAKENQSMADSFKVKEIDPLYVSGMSDYGGGVHETREEVVFPRSNEIFETRCEFKFPREDEKNHAQKSKEEENEEVKGENDPTATIISDQADG
ncbi:hypothetical protein HK098_005982 [Nowakowskiella sp. JEL0407]|nr:hypothetical protein HK098_005982 [Nowakowskiella sp. JEL0407]